MDLGLKGKKALVTGASSGLGAVAALALAEEKADVIINGRDLKRLEKSAKQIYDATGATVKIVVGDVSKEDDIVRIKNEIGDIDILVSNAGGPPPGQLTEHDRKKWRDASELVMFSAINLTRVFIDNMINNKWGRLIYITSIGVLQPVDDLILSNTFRAAVTGFCKTTSNNYAKYGITANCVCPGYTGTERLSELINSRAEKAGITPEQVVEGFNQMIPAGRIGKPEELAALIAFLASDKASYITGSSIAVDGGVVKSLI